MCITLFCHRFPTACLLSYLGGLREESKGLRGWKVNGARMSRSGFSFHFRLGLILWKGIHSFRKQLEVSALAVLVDLRKVQVEVRGRGRVSSCTERFSLVEPLIRRNIQSFIHGCRVIKSCCSSIQLAVHVLVELHIVSFLAWFIYPSASQLLPPSLSPCPGTTATLLPLLLSPSPTSVSIPRHNRSKPLVRPAPCSQPLGTPEPILKQPPPAPTSHSLYRPSRRRRDRSRRRRRRGRRMKLGVSTGPKRSVIALVRVQKGWA